MKSPEFVRLPLPDRSYLGYAFGFSIGLMAAGFLGMLHGKSSPTAHPNLMEVSIDTILLAALSTLLLMLASAAMAKTMRARQMPDSFIIWLALGSMCFVVMFGYVRTLNQDWGLLGLIFIPAAILTALTYASPKRPITSSGNLKSIGPAKDNSEQAQRMQS